MGTTIAVLTMEPDAVQDRALADYSQHYSKAASWLAGKLVDTQISDRVRLHRLFYTDLRSRFGLPSQSAVLCIKHVSSLCRGRTSPPGAAALTPIPFDRHLFSLKSVDRLSLATLEGRVVVPCAVAAYRTGELPVASGALLRDESRWIFLLRTTLPESMVQPNRHEGGMFMSDNLLNRITRLISGITHNALSQAEQAASLPVLEQAIRDIESAVKEVRGEIGKQEATKHNVQTRMTELQSESDELDQKISLALKESKDELAEAGAGRQIDIENQLRVLRRSLDDADEEITKLTDSLNALQAGRREAQQKLRNIKAAPASTNGQGAARSGSAKAKADAALDSAKRLGEDFSGVPAEESRVSQKDLDELDELHRQNEIRERLAKHRASLKASQ